MTTGKTVQRLAGTVGKLVNKCKEKVRAVFGAWLGQ